MVQVNTDGKHSLLLHEQLAHLHTENTQTKLQTLRLMKTLLKIITCLLCYVHLVKNLSFIRFGGKDV